VPYQVAGNLFDGDGKKSVARVVADGFAVGIGNPKAIAFLPRGLTRGAARG